MKAIVQSGYGAADALALREIDKPGVGEDRVLVRVRAASINAADWHLTRWLLRLLGSGNVRGFDVAGHVEAVGKNVTRFKPGDEVFGTGNGTFAEYVTTTEDRLAAKPRVLTFEQASAIPFAGVTALQGLRDKAHVQPGQRVLIYGAGGGVGTLAVQIAKSLGAHVTAVSSTRNVDLLRSIGADEVIDYTKEDFTKRGQGYDVLFDIGANRSFADCRRILAPNGTLVLVGAPKAFWAIVSRLLMAPLLSRLGSQRFAPFLARGRYEDLVVLKELVEAGRLSPVIDRQYPLSETPDAVRYVGTGEARGKVVIRVASGASSEQRVGIIVSDKCQQAAAIPYRIADAGPEVLLVTSISSGKWILPKGNVDAGNSPAQTAEIEAREEAGVIGSVWSASVGAYDYEKGSARLLVQAFPLKVEQVLEEWAESKLRRRRWTLLAEAMRLVAEPGIKAVLERFADSVQHRE